jgi:hypothetical protein
VNCFGWRSCPRPCRHGYDERRWAFGKIRQCLEPTIGLEPMTCRLRIDCSTN